MAKRSSSRSSTPSGSRLGTWFRRGRRTSTPPAGRPRTLDELRDADPWAAWETVNRYGTRQVYDPWAVLGLEPGADWDAICEAHRCLARHHHPDLPEVEDDEAMVAVNVAFHELERLYGRTRGSRLRA
jgi:hypothetical protein